MQNRVRKSHDSSTANFMGTLPVQFLMGPMLIRAPCFSKCSAVSILTLLKVLNKGSTFYCSLDPELMHLVLNI